MQIQRSEHFTYKKLFRFTLPTIAMMIVTSIYSIVDGFFMSNFAGKPPGLTSGRFLSFYFFSPPGRDYRSNAKSHCRFCRAPEWAQAEES